MAPSLVEPKPDGQRDSGATHVLKRQLAIGYALLTVAIGGAVVMVLVGMLLVATVEVVTGGYPSSPLAGLPIVIVSLYAFALYTKVVLPIRY